MGNSPMDNSQHWQPRTQLAPTELASRPLPVQGRVEMIALPPRMVALQMPPPPLHPSGGNRSRGMVPPTRLSEVFREGGAVETGLHPSPKVKGIEAPFLCRMVERELL